MYAIVDIAGKQYKVTEKEKLLVPQLEAEVGSKIELDRVLLVSSDAGIQVGQPVVAGAKVAVNILEHERGKKIIVFKKRRREDYKVTRGHRQTYTRIQIEKISL